MEQTTARLRKTFHYPADNDSDDSLPEDMDDEEQEHLIQNLTQKNDRLNLLYNQILLAVPLLSIVPYMATLFNQRTSLLSILSISSLLSTAFLLFTLPPGRTSIPFLDALNKSKSALDKSSTHTLRQFQEGGPIAQYLPLLNAALCVVLGLLGMVFRGKEEVWRGFGWLPGLVYVVVLVAQVVMGSVDPESELGGLRYGFKGA